MNPAPSLPRPHVFVVLVAVLGFVAAYACVATQFTVEDAGISFAFAQNLADGHGLVPYAGGPWVEAYSNPLWTFLLALAAGVGVDPRTAALSFGALFGGVAVGLAAAVALRGGARPASAALAAVLLAASSQFVIWSASGLETALFVFLLLLGLAVPWRWAWVPLSLLAMTRPEGLAYGVLAGLVRALTVDERRPPWRQVLKWLGCFLLPLVVFEVWRIAAFAWPLPNTYYAKLAGEGAFEPWSWDARGWSYVTSWFVEHRAWVALPMLPLALAGTHRRLWLAGMLSALVGVLVVLGPPEGAQSAWEVGRTLAVGAGCVALAFMGARGATNPVRTTLWCWTSFAVFFAVFSGGDWMRGHRWFALVVPPAAVLVALGLDTVWRAVAVPRAIALVVMVGVGGAWTWSEFAATRAWLVQAEISLDDVRKRVRYIGGLAQQLRLEERLVVADVDMGANLFYSDWVVVDMAGLADVMFAHNPEFPTRLLSEYLLEERRPHFLHAHRGWAAHSGLLTLRAFHDEYLPLPAYSGRFGRPHGGNHVRRDLVVVSTGPPPEGAPAAREVVLADVVVDASRVQQGGRLTGELVVQVDRVQERDFELLAAVADAHGRHVATARLKPGWDWLPPRRWLPGERILVPLDVPLKGLPPGEYRLRVAVGPPVDAAEFALDVRISVLPDAPPEAGEETPTASRASTTAWELRQRVLAEDWAHEEAPAGETNTWSASGGDQEQLLWALGYLDGSAPSSQRSGVVLWRPEMAHSGLNLVLSRHAPEAVLLGMDGTVLHRWASGFDEAFPDSNVAQEHSGRHRWRRVALTPDGGLVAIHEGLGILRLDRDSDIVWVRDLPAHHDLEFLPNGGLLVLTRRTRHLAARPSAPILDDHLAELGTDGELVSSVSLFDALERSRWSWLLAGISPTGGDAFHTNELELVDEDLASRLPGVSVGDVMVSVRNLDALLIVNRERGVVVWAATGGWARQHDPDILPGGNLLLFDNGDASASSSSVIEVDPETLEHRRVYGGLQSHILGAQQRLPNGNTLITESTAGRALEVTAEGVVVWEYINPHLARDDGDHRAMLAEVTRIDAEQWK